MQYATRAARALLGATAHPGGTDLTVRALVLAGLGGGDRVLDVACGDGETLRLLRERGATAVGVDLEPRAVERCGGRAVVADAHALPLPDGGFDGVLLECSLSTFADPRQALREAARVLRPDGVLVLTDVVLDREAAAPEVVEAVDRLTSARTVEGYLDLLAEAGFVVTKSEDRADDARLLVRRVRRRLVLVSRAHGRTARACERAVRDRALGYQLLLAVKAPVS